MRTFIYIGETILDLFAKSVIAITYQIVDVRDLKIRKFSFTSSFDLPPTQNNLLTLGLPQSVQSNSSIPYSQIMAKCFSNGLEYFKGRFEVSRFDKVIKSNIYDLQIDVFDSVRGKKLYELGHINQTAWNASDIDGFRTASSGVVAPVINWGDFDTATPSINPTLYLPSYFYSGLVMAALENTGFTFDGEILTDTDFTDLIIPFAGDEFIYVQQYQDERTFNANNTVQEVFLSPVSEKITVDSVVQGTAGWYETANSRFQIPNFSSSGDIGTINLYLVMSLNIEHGYAPSLALERIQIMKNGVTVLASYDINIATEFPTDYHLSIKAEGVTFQDSDYFEVYFISVNEIPDVVTINTVNFYGNVTRTPNRNMLFHNYLLPDIEQIDILMDFFVRFGAFLTLGNDGQTVTIKTINKIINNKSLAVDWTDKRVSRKDVVSFDYQSYAQENYFLYETADGLVETLGRGSIPVNNENLEDETEYFTSIFENCDTQPPEDVSVNMALIPVYDGTSVAIEDFVNEPGLKILTLRDKLTEEPDITFNSTPRSDYKVAYFIDPSLPKDTGFQYFIDQHYSGLVLSFDKTKLIDRDYYLTVEDILTPPELVYDGGNYFLVNKIPKFIPERVTERVELLRVF